MFKNLAIWLVLGIVLMTVINQFSSHQIAQAAMDYCSSSMRLKQGHITKVLIQGRTLEATTTEGKKITPMRRRSVDGQRSAQVQTSRWSPRRTRSSRC